ncbi:MAG: polymerase subunit sigma-24 [Myxococcales bacterium]|nr:polymerase subunit sigma-24 [Myxococcales bacterium]
MIPVITNAAFDELVAPLRGELHAHCYRMLGSIHDADDALQDALLDAWRGFATLENRSSFRAWLYKIATHASLAVIAKRPKRISTSDYGPAATGTDLAASLLEPLWIEPYPDDPQMQYEQRESIELAFIAALQFLPATQRAVLLLRDVLGFSAEETARLLETTVASITSALQRGRAQVADRIPARSQQATLRELGEPAERALVAAYVDAWGRGDVDAILSMLSRDAKFTMPPIPTWFVGHESLARFFTERIFATGWRLVPMRANGQLAFACYQGPDFRLGALQLVTLRDRAIVELTGFLDPAIHRRFLLAER